MTMTKNNNLRSMDVPIMDKVFAMESGWVLNFVNRTFAEFFREELGVDIDHLRWAVQGNSKAKRLRYYLRQADQQTALNALNALWEYREATSVTENYPELDEAVRTAFFKIIERLGGKLPTRVVPSETQPTPRIDEAVASELGIACLRFLNWTRSHAAMRSRSSRKTCSTHTDCQHAPPSVSQANRLTVASCLAIKPICLKRSGRTRKSMHPPFALLMPRSRTRRAGRAVC